jgi:hypothetical protein
MRDPAMKRWGVLTIATLLVWATGGVTADEEFLAAGTLTMDGGAEARAQGTAQTTTATTNEPEARWSARVSTDGKTVAGRVQLAGVKRDGYIDGRLAGDFVFGTVYDENDEEIGFFNGTLGTDGAVGTFTAIGGRTGSWSFPVVRSSQ